MDVFLSRKKRVHSSSPFAFEGFAYKRDALKVITNVNGMIERGSTLEVKEAKYGRFSKTNKNREANEKMDEARRIKVQLGTKRWMASLSKR